MKNTSFFIILIFYFICIIAYLQCENDKNPIVSNSQIIETVSPEQAKNLIDQNHDNDDFIIIDIRTPGEYNGGHIEGALNIDFYNKEFEILINQLDKSRIYLIYCTGGYRSSQALTKMESTGFLTVYNLAGGISAWRNAGYPVVI